MSVYVIEHYTSEDPSKPVSTTEFEYQEGDKEYDEFTIVCQHDNEKLYLMFRSDAYLRAIEKSANLGLLIYSFIAISLMILALTQSLRDQLMVSFVLGIMTLMFLALSPKYLLSDVADFEKNITLKGFFDEIHNIEKLS